MLFVPITALALLSASSAPTMPADSIADAARDVALTDRRVEEYVAVSQALQAYWRSEGNNAAQIQTAFRSGHLPFYGTHLLTRDVDYPAVAQRDTAVARIIATHHFAPEELLPVKASLVRALLYSMATPFRPLADTSAILQANMALVARHRHALDDLELARAPLLQLTADHLAAYLAVKCALRAFWHDSAHAALARVADSTERHPVFVALGEPWSLVARVYNYPVLVTREPALAAIFAKNHFAPEQFELIQMAVHQAMMEVVAHDLQAPLVNTYIAPNGGVLRRRLHRSVQSTLQPGPQAPVLKTTGADSVTVVRLPARDEH